MFTPRRRREALSLGQLLDSQILSLFAAGEQGAWYDPSDMSSMWQDTAGTIPVNAIGQRVARINDKSGRGNHATQATTANQPFLQSASGLPYLDFDGVNDSLATASINFTATDKITFGVGVRKPSDANIACLAELSASIVANAGGFDVLAPGDAATANYRFDLRGDAANSTGFRATTFTAPVTSVLSCVFDIAGAARATEIFPRINGAIPALAGAGIADAGAGNFGNYPLYIGARGGTTLFLAGRVYGMVTRGANSNAAQVSSIEAWCNMKTGAF